MPVISVRVSEDMKGEMDKLRFLNWSEAIREAIKRIIEEKNERNLAIAVLINERLRRKSPDGWNSLKALRC